MGLSTRLIGEQCSDSSIVSDAEQRWWALRVFASHSAGGPDGRIASVRKIVGNAGWFSRSEPLDITPALDRLDELMSAVGLCCQVFEMRQHYLECVFDFVRARRKANV